MLMIKMLTLTNFIAKGATRICFEHPNDAEKCIKVMARFKDEHLLKREIKTYLNIKYYVGDYLPGYEIELAETNLGKGLVCELLRDDNGAFSKPLEDYMKDHQIGDELKGQMCNFAYNLVEHDIIFYDFNLRNFIVQIRNGMERLYYVDLKSYDNYKPMTFLRLEKVITPLAKRIMVRRLKRLFAILNINVK